MKDSWQSWSFSNFVFERSNSKTFRPLTPDFCQPKKNECCTAMGLSLWHDQSKEIIWTLEQTWLDTSWVSNAVGCKINRHCGNFHKGHFLQCSAVRKMDPSQLLSMNLPKTDGATDICCVKMQLCVTFCVSWPHGWHRFAHLHFYVFRLWPDFTWELLIYHWKTFHSDGFWTLWRLVMVLKGMVSLNSFSILL